MRDWSPFAAVQLRYNLLDRSPERELLPMADAFDLPVFAWGPLAEGRLTGKYLSGHSGRMTEAGRPYTGVGSDDLVRDVVGISHELGCSPAQVAISWVRQQPGPVIPLIAAPSCVGAYRIAHVSALKTPSARPRVSGGVPAVSRT